MKVQPIVVHHEEKNPAPQPKHHESRQHYREHRPEDFWGRNDWWGNPFEMPQWEAPKPQKHVIHTLFGDMEV